MDLLCCLNTVTHAHTRSGFRLFPPWDLRCGLLEGKKSDGVGGKRHEDGKYDDKHDDANGGGDCDGAFSGVVKYSI